MIPMLKCYILDDEQQAVDALSAMLKKKFTQQISICGSNTDAALAITEIEESKPDILFLDVEMPEMNGLEVLRHFPERHFHLIFTTAHEKYALPALKAAATDYLVKPLSPQDVFEAIQKCVNKKNEADAIKPQDNRISISTSGGLLLVNTDEIIHIEAHNNYSHFYFTTRPKVIVSKTLGEFEELLMPFNFFRVHQSHLVNMKHVESVHHSDGDYILLKGNHRVEISRRRKPDFMQLLKKQ
jgi:two-component system, LytTR family, response regulator